MFSFQTMSPGQKPKRKYHLLIFSILLFCEYTGGYNTGVIVFPFWSIVCFAESLCKGFMWSNWFEEEFGVLGGLFQHLI